LLSLPVPQLLLALRCNGVDADLASDEADIEIIDPDGSLKGRPADAVNARRVEIVAHFLESPGRHLLNYPRHLLGASHESQQEWVKRQATRGLIRKNIDGTEEWLHCELSQERAAEIDRELQLEHEGRLRQKLFPWELQPTLTDSAEEKQKARKPRRRR
jgi:hypothetical protein